VDARWTKKNNETYYGYKDHVNVDAAYKLIRKYEVMSASSADIKSFEALLDKKNTDKRVWADKAYRGKQAEEALGDQFLDRINHRKTQGEWISQTHRRENVKRSKIRVRVEHVFGFMTNSMRGKAVRTIGIVQAKAKIALMNLTYNTCRYEQLCRIGVS